MRKIFRSIISSILKRLAQNYLSNNDVRVVFVTGDKFKTHIKDSIITTLNNSNIKTRGNFKGYNFDIGIPLSILNLQAGFTSAFKWFQLINDARKQSKIHDDIKVMVLEIEISREGDSNTILDIIKPTITIIDSFGKNNPFVDQYKTIINATKEMVLINSDQVLSKLIGEENKCKTYGTKEGLTIFAKNIQETNEYQRFMVQKGNFSQNMKMNTFGIHHLYAFLVTNLVLDYFYN